MANIPKQIDTDWKDRYFRTVNELDEQQRASYAQLTRLNRDVVAILGHFRGRAPQFDRELDETVAALSRDDETAGGRVRTLVTSFERIIADCDLSTAMTNAVPDPFAGLRELVDALPVCPSTAGFVDDLRTRLDAADVRGREAAVIAELASRFGEFIGPDGKARGNAGDTFSVHEARDNLQILLDHLSVPEHVQTQLAAITSRLQEAADNTALRTIAKDVANCLLEYVGALQSELTNLGGFLVAVKDRLDNLSGHVVQQRQDRRRSAAARDELDSSVRQSLDHMRVQVSSAVDIAQLKCQIQNQICTLDSKVAGYLQSETRRAADAEASLRALTDQLAMMRKESETLRSKLARAQSRAASDTLTGLPNRLAYGERLALERAQMIRAGTPLALAVLDLDRFKSINDTWGHQAGDRVLRHVARELRKQIRAQDFLARFGGEEFVMLLPGTDRRGALALADVLRRHIADCRFKFRDQRVPITISCGVTELTSDEPVSQAFARADAALYAAKESGRNRCAASPV